MATSHTIGLASQKDRLRTYVRSRTNHFGVQVFGTMVPRPEAGVTLPRRGGTSPVLDRAQISLQYDDASVRNMIASRERLRDVLGAAGLSIDVGGPFHDLRPGSSVHFGGTARMHRDPQLGVVDRWSRIHDAPDVVVCDMSVFTTGPEKNPTLTAMALAIRASDRLAQSLRGDL